MRQLSPVEVVVSGYNSPEGPAFDRHGNLFFVNWLSGAIMRVSPEGMGTGAATEFANTGGIPAGLAFHRDGTLYVADEGEHLHGVVRVTPEGQITPWAQEYQGERLNGANDLVFDGQGVLYFSDPWGSSLELPIGAFYRAFPDGRLEQIDSALAFPNGVAIDVSERAVYLAETPKNHILRYELAPDGSIGKGSVFARLSGTPGPDGMAFDEAGNLYVAHFGEGRVDVFSPAGDEIGQIKVPGAKTTNVAFGGRDQTTLIITEVETASVYRVLLDVRGQPLFGAA